VEIFRSLISNHAEVDVLKAVSVGSMSDGAPAAAGMAGEALVAEAAGEGHGEDGDQSVPAGYYDEAARPSKVGAAAAGAATRSKSAEVQEDSARASARDILLSLPGVNVHNFRDIMNSVTNLAELSAMTEEQLSPLVGPVNARKLFAFLTQNS